MVYGDGVVAVGASRRLVSYLVDAILIKRYRWLRHLYDRELYCGMPSVAVPSRRVFYALG